MAWESLAAEIAAEMAALSVPAIYEGLVIRRVRYPARHCICCGQMIAHARKARWCPPCRRQRDLEKARVRAKESYLRRAEEVKARRREEREAVKPMPRCADCGELLTHRNAQRCSKCAQKHRKAWSAAYWRIWRQRARA